MMSLVVWRVETLLLIAVVQRGTIDIIFRAGEVL
jgi:hypothetical protein